MSMYGQFKTSDTLEIQGVVIDYGDFRVTLARAGGVVAHDADSALLETLAEEGVET